MLRLSHTQISIFPSRRDLHFYTKSTLLPRFRTTRCCKQQKFCDCKSLRKHEYPDLVLTEIHMWVTVMLLERPFTTWDRFKKVGRHWKFLSETQNRNAPGRQRSMWKLTERARARARAARVANTLHQVKTRNNTLGNPLYTRAPLHHRLHLMKCYAFCGIFYIFPRWMLGLHFKRKGYLTFGGFFSKLMLVVCAKVNAIT